MSEAEKKQIKSRAERIAAELNHIIDRTRTGHNAKKYAIKFAIGVCLLIIVGAAGWYCAYWERDVVIYIISMTAAVLVYNIYMDIAFSKEKDRMLRILYNPIAVFMTIKVCDRLSQAEEPWEIESMVSVIYHIFKNTGWYYKKIEPYSEAIRDILYKPAPHKKRAYGSIL